MTTKEKLEKVLDALGLIETGTWSDMKSIKKFAGSIHAELTTQRTEPVEVKRWEIRNVPTHWFKEMEDAIGFCNRTATPHSHIIELTGTDTRPIPEPGVWKGKISRVDGHHFGVYLNIPVDDENLMGKRVIVEVCE